MGGQGKGEMASTNEAAVGCRVAIQSVSELHGKHFHLFHHFIIMHIFTVFVKYKDIKVLYLSLIAAMMMAVTVVARIAAMMAARMMAAIMAARMAAIMAATVAAMRRLHLCSFHVISFPCL